MQLDNVYSPAITLLPQRCALVGSSIVDPETGKLVPHGHILLDVAAGPLLVKRTLTTLSAVAMAEAIRRLLATLARDPANSHMLAAERAIENRVAVFGRPGAPDAITLHFGEYPESVIVMLTQVGADQLATELESLTSNPT